MGDFAELRHVLGPFLDGPFLFDPGDNTWPIGDSVEILNEYPDGSAAVIVRYLGWQNTGMPAFRVLRAAEWWITGEVGVLQCVDPYTGELRPPYRFTFADDDQAKEWQEDRVPKDVLLKHSQRIRDSYIDDWPDAPQPRPTTPAAL